MSDGPTFYLPTINHIQPASLVFEFRTYFSYVWKKIYIYYISPYHIITQNSLTNRQQLKTFKSVNCSIKNFTTLYWFLQRPKAYSSWLFELRQKIWNESTFIYFYLQGEEWLNKHNFMILCHNSKAFLGEETKGVSNSVQLECKNERYFSRLIFSNYILI